MVSFVSSASAASAVSSQSSQGLKVANGVQTNLDAFSIPTAGSLSSFCVNQQFAADGVTELSLSVGRVKALAASGSVELLGDDGLVRIVLVGADGGEKLLFESYAALDAAAKTFSFSNLCEETCVLPVTTPSKILVRIENARLTVNCLNYLPASKNLDSGADAAQLHARQVAFKLAAFNDAFARGTQRWQAGETRVSSYSYAQKKRMLKDDTGDFSNIQGFEYYKNGVFEVKTSAASAVGSAGSASAAGAAAGAANTARAASAYFVGPTATPSAFSYVFPPSFDWRNHHSKNFVTSVKDQGQCGSCWVFSSVAAIESAANIYYNRQLSLDLSEQDVLCRKTDGCDGWSPAWALDQVKTSGIVDEACFAYRATDECEQMRKCSDWQQRLWKTDYVPNAGPTPDDLKLDLMWGTDAIVIRSWRHAVELVGYYTNSSGDVWIVKNSWGPDWGDHGFGYLILPQGSIIDYDAVFAPYFVANLQQYTVNCVDEDRDYYCNWGNGPRPSTCPPQCVQAEDCDDSNPSLGTFVSETDFRCSQIQYWLYNPLPWNGNNYDSPVGFNAYPEKLIGGKWRGVAGCSCSARYGRVGQPWVELRLTEASGYQGKYQGSAALQPGAYSIGFSCSCQGVTIATPSNSVFRVSFHREPVSNKVFSAPPEPRGLQDFSPYRAAGIAGIILVVAALAWLLKRNSKKRDKKRSKKK